MIAGGRLVGAEAVVVGRRGDRRAQQTAVLVNRADDGGAEHQELGVVVRVVTRHQQAAELGVAQREVHVLAGAVDAVERLLVEEALHAVLAGDRLEGRHQQLLVVGGLIGALEHRRDLELPGRDLVVAGLGGDAELEELALGVHHEAEHALRDGAEVVVVELLALGGLGAEEGAAGVDQVGAGQVEVAVDQEVLLLGAAVGDDVLGVGVPEEPQHALGVHRHRLLRAQHRCLVVEGLTGHRDEDGRDAQGVAVRVLQDVRRAHHVPAGVAAGLEGVAQPAVRERGRVGLALDQGLARERRERRTVTDRVEEAVVLLRGQAGQRVEDVGVVGRTLLQRPVLHRRGHGVGDIGVERRRLLDRREHRLVDRLRQPLLHHAEAEDVRTEDLPGLLARVEADRPAGRRPRRRRWPADGPCSHSCDFGLPRRQSPLPTADSGEPRRATCRDCFAAVTGPGHRKCRDLGVQSSGERGTSRNPQEVQSSSNGDRASATTGVPSWSRTTRTSGR